MIWWAAKWSQTNELSGHREHLVTVDWRREIAWPLLFRTRRECREWIEKEYGYIKHRKDLRTEPHCWRLPKAVKVEIRERH